MVTSVLVLLGVAVASVRGYSEGAPAEVCNTLTPLHLQPPQTTPCPYRIELGTSELSSNPIKYHPIGGNVLMNVTLTGVQGFKGFILQARLNDKVVGRFEPCPLHYRMIDCNGADENTATHVDNSIKSEVVFKWVPPTKVEGQVWFYASVVKTFDVFWIDVTSEPLQLTLPKAS